jgi:hypothetical protein
MNFNNSKPLDLSGSSGKVVVVLQEGLKAVIGKRLVILLGIITKDLRQSGICNDLALVGGILEILLLDVLTQVLGNLNARVKLIGRQAGKLGNRLTNLNRLKETRVVVLTGRGLLLLDDTSSGSLESLDATSDATEELDSRVLIGTIAKTGNLSLQHINKLGKLSHDRLTSGDDTSLGLGLLGKLNGINNRSGSNNLLFLLGRADRLLCGSSYNGSDDGSGYGNSCGLGRLLG